MRLLPLPPNWIGSAPSTLHPTLEALFIPSHLQGHRKSSKGYCLSSTHTTNTNRIMQLHALKAK